MQRETWNYLLEMNRWFIRVGLLRKADAFFLTRIGAISLHRIAACLFALFPVLISVSAAAQQSGTYSQTLQVVQLPASGRTLQSSGTVTSQQTTSTGTESTVLQPSVTVQRFATDPYLRCSLSYREVEETTLQRVYRFDNDLTIKVHCGCSDLAPIT
jgi:hypothetical protein